MLVPRGVDAAHEAYDSLVGRIRSGDRRAETELVRRFSRAILFILRRRTGDDEGARDLFQETFIVALRQLRDGQLQDPGALPAFMRQVALNLARGEGRKSERRQTDNDLEAIERAADAAMSAQATLEREERIRLVRQLIADLPVPRDRELLLRYYVTDEDKDTICTALGLGTEHFDRVLHRARRRLRELMFASLGTSAGNIVEL